MPYLVDGHNLIPKIGLRLDSEDDEHDLIEFLQDFARNAATTVEVYFDGAPAGMAGSHRYGRVRATFVSRMSSADAAIRRRVQSLGGEARNWTVVSSDREVRQAARAGRAKVSTSEEFASKVRAESGRRGSAGGTPREDGRGLEQSEDDVQHWLGVFKKPGN